LNQKLIFYLYYFWGGSIILFVRFEGAKPTQALTISAYEQCTVDSYLIENTENQSVKTPRFSQKTTNIDLAHYRELAISNILSVSIRPTNKIRVVRSTRSVGRSRVGQRWSYATDRVQRSSWIKPCTRFWSEEPIFVMYKKYSRTVYRCPKDFASFTSARTLTIVDVGSQPRRILVEIRNTSMLLQVVVV
jgi:hypothetical protein